MGVEKSSCPLFIAQLRARNWAIHHILVLAGVETRWLRPVFFCQIYSSLADKEVFSWKSAFTG